MLSFKIKFSLLLKLWPVYKRWTQIPLLSVRMNNMSVNNIKEGKMSGLF